MQALVETDPQASWTFVCDGLNTHKSESLIRFAAEQCGLPEDLGVKGKSGILKNKERKASILRFIKQYNITAKPFKWIYKGVSLTA